MDVPATRYARSGDLNIAYQIAGEGPFDVVFVPPFVSHVELLWRVPSWAAFNRRLASSCRLILFDKRGTGMSDRVSGATSLEARMDDVRAVMDAAGSRRAAVIGLSEGVFGAFTDVLHSVRTEEPAFERVFGAPLFDFLGRHPEQGAVFVRAMGDFNRAATMAAPETYDWTGLRCIVDFGGGTGTLIASVLERHPEARGILFDLPEVAESAREAPAVAALEGRCQVVGGDFFRLVPAGGDAYVLSWILHDWDDERALAILRNCRAAIADGGRLVIVETILPPGDEPHFGKVLDVAMLVVTGGRERTEAEYGDLLATAGFRLTRVLPTASPMSVVDALAA